MKKIVFAYIAVALVATGCKKAERTPNPPCDLEMGAGIQD